MLLAELLQRFALFLSTIWSYVCLLAATSYFAVVAFTTVSDETSNYMVNLILFSAAVVLVSLLVERIAEGLVNRWNTVDKLFPPFDKLLSPLDGGSDE